MEEIWKKIREFPNYSVSNTGRIKNSRGIIMKTRIGTSGYETVGLVDSSTHKSFNRTVHRIVLENFLDNPQEKETVNHKDGNKLNNKLENLEWSTWSENIKHSFDIGLKELTKLSSKNNVRKAVNARKRMILCVETEEIYESSQDAGRKKGIDPRQIRAAASGDQKTAHGYHWLYLGEEGEKPK